MILAPELVRKGSPRPHPDHVKGSSQSSDSSDHFPRAPLLIFPHHGKVGCQLLHAAELTFQMCALWGRRRTSGPLLIFSPGHKFGARGRGRRVHQDAPRRDGRAVETRAHRLVHHAVRGQSQWRAEPLQPFRGGRPRRSQRWRRARFPPLCVCFSATSMRMVEFLRTCTSGTIETFIEPWPEVTTAPWRPWTVSTEPSAWSSATRTHSTVFKLSSAKRKNCARNDSSWAARGPWRESNALGAQR